MDFAVRNSVELNPRPDCVTSIRFAFDAKPEARRALRRRINLALLQGRDYEQISDLPIAREGHLLEVRSKIDLLADSHNSTPCGIGSNQRSIGGPKARLTEPPILNPRPPWSGRSSVPTVLARTIRVSRPFYGSFCRATPLFGHLTEGQRISSRIRRSGRNCFSRRN